MNCKLCQQNIYCIDYKETKKLREFLTSQMKIAAVKRTGLCKRHQRRIAEAVKLARQMALLPYTRGQVRKTRERIERGRITI